MAEAQDFLAASLLTVLWAAVAFHLISFRTVF
jgi:hypothetical protein